MQLSLANQKRLWFAYFVAMICWSSSAYYLISTWASEGTLFSRTFEGKPYVLDYLLFYEDEYLAIHAKSDHINIYDQDTQAAGIAKLMAPVVPTTKFYSHYPPLLFVFSIPFGFLPMLWSYVAWNLAGMAALLLSTLPFAYRRFGKTFPFFMVAAAVVTSFPVWNCFELGQSSFFLVGGIALFFALLKRQKYFLAGLSTLCLLIKVQYLPVMVLIGLIMGRVKFVLGGIFSALLAVAICVFTLGWDNCLEWPKVVLHGETNSSNIGLIAPAMMQNIRGILNLVVGDDTSTVRMISAGLCIITILLIGYLWTAPYKKLQATTNYAFEVLSAISMMIMLLFSVHTHAHDYCVFVCSCVWLYVAVLDLPQSKLVSWLKFLLVGFPIFGWLLFVAQPIFQHILKLQPLAVYLAAVLGLALAVWFGKNAVASTRHP
ncbi:MAG TPA: glycosyltransferase family 87 protein [Drouetiella sp.]